MAAGPIAIAVRLADGLVLRGHEWSRDGPAVVFVHDLEDDLDAWGPLTGAVADKGFRVISMELRGHGLSDGEPDPGALRKDMTAMLHEVTGAFGPVALVAYGRLTETLLFLDASHGVPVQVMIGPRPGDPVAIDWRTTRPATRLVLRGSLDREVADHVGFLYPRMMGEKLQVTGASRCDGPDLLADRPRLAEHMVMFLRRYLTGHHLAWIAARADRIDGAAPRAGGEASIEMTRRWLTWP